MVCGSSSSTSKPICEGLEDVGDHEEESQHANMFEDAQDHLEQEDVGEEHQEEQDEDEQ